MTKRWKAPVALLLAALPLGGCAYESLPPAETSTAAQTVVIQGTLTGLHGSGLVLQNNDGDDIAVGADGSFAFSAPVAVGDSYDVTVSLQPTSPAEDCTVDNGSGDASAAGVTDVVVTCVLNEFAVGGHVHGLESVGLVLANNGEEIALAKDGDFVFFENVVMGAPYAVTITQEPEDATCEVHHGQGTMGAGGELAIDVTCTTRADRLPL
jgi:hypothetical protein